MRRHAGFGFLILLLAGIPWYWPADDRTLVLGIPAWVAVAIAAGAVTAALTIACLLAPWPQEDEGEDDPR